MERFRMKDKFRVLPKRIARSRKIQVRQFEPEEIWIEFELDIKDEAAVQDALREATQLANEYLDEEEKRLRGINGGNMSASNGGILQQTVSEYGLELTNQGKRLGKLEIVRSKEPQFANFIHLWYRKNSQDQKTYIGYLRKDTGEFKYKQENKELVNKYGINEGTHFKIIPAKKITNVYD